MTTSRTARIPPVGLEGILDAPHGARAVVLFAHGSGSGRLSPRNTRVAGALREGRLATLLFDLLTPDQAGDRTKVFDIPLLAERLGEATDWVRRQPEVGGLPIGYFGASTGAAAVLVAAAAVLAPPVGAVVSRGGRPDLAGPALEAVRAPTLLIVGGRDVDVLALNRGALERLRCEKKALEIVPGAGHLFEEPGALDAVTVLARQWIADHLLAGRYER